MALPGQLLKTLQIPLYLPRADLRVHCHPIVPKTGPYIVGLRSVEQPAGRTTRGVGQFYDDFGSGFPSSMTGKKRKI